MSRVRNIAREVRRATARRNRAANAIAEKLSRWDGPQVLAGDILARLYEWDLANSLLDHLREAARAARQQETTTNQQERK